MKMQTSSHIKSKMALARAPLAEVIWMDAASHSRVDKLNLNNLNSLLVESHTFGKIVAENSRVLVIATHMNNSDGLDFIAIPKGWIKTKKFAKNFRVLRNEPISDIIRMEEK